MFSLRESSKQVDVFISVYFLIVLLTALLGGPLYRRLVFYFFSRTVDKFSLIGNAHLVFVILLELPVMVYIYANYRELLKKSIKDIITIFLLIYTGIALVSLAYTIDLNLSLVSFIAILSGVLFYLIISVYLTFPSANGLNISAENRFVNLSLTINYFVTFIVVFAFFYSFGIKHDFSTNRLSIGSFIHPNTLGFLVAVNIPLIHSRLRGSGGRSLSVFSLVVCLIALIMARSRSAWLAIAVAYGLYPIFSRSGYDKKKLFFYLLLYFSGVLLVVWLVYSRRIPFLTHVFRLTKDQLISITYRKDIWAFSLRRILKSPLIGVGIGAFQSIPYDVYQAYVPIKVTHAHNLFLNAGVEMGVPGALTMVAIFIVSFVKLLKMQSICNSCLAHRILEGLLLLLTVILVFHFSESTIRYPFTTILFYTFLAMVSSLSVVCHLKSGDRQ